MPLTRQESEEFGRACERAWQDHLEEGGYLVTPLCEAVGNAEGRRAPMLPIGGGRKVRAPDFFTEGGPANVTEYWEVKGRSNPFAAKTGELVHYTDLARFEDYVAVLEARGKDVWLVVYEAATSTRSSRWLKIHVRAAKQFGYRDVRHDRDGRPARYWNWPVSQMEVIDGPALSATDGAAPALESEIDAPAPGEVELAEAELTMRTNDRQSPPIPQTGLASMIAANPRAALDTLRGRIGIPSFPRYSVLRIGGFNRDDLLGLLHYGIRVFLVVQSEAIRKVVVESTELRPFAEARMLECAVSEAIGEKGCWFVDGVLPDQDEWLNDLLNEVDRHGGINVQQFRIVHRPPNSDVVVAAGAGTGKTETMAERIMFLLSTAESVSTIDGGTRASCIGVDEISLVTFTREAAANMRRRLARTIGLRQRLCRRCIHPTMAWLMQLSKCRISTIHMFAKSVLQDYGHSIGYSPCLKISNQTMQFRAIRDSALSARGAATMSRTWEGLHRKSAPPYHEWATHIDDLWQALGNNGVSLLDEKIDVDWGTDPEEEAHAAITQAVRETIEEVGKEFGIHCLREQVVPTDQLVSTALSAIRKSGSTVNRSATRFLFVDEFQDTDTLQMELLLELRRRFGTHLFMVGDAKQGIYRFRGASGNAFDDLAARAKRLGLADLCQTPSGLTRNFRTGSTLLDDFHSHFVKLGDEGRRLLPYRSVDRLRPDPISPRDSKAIRINSVRGAEFARFAAAEIAAWRENEATKNLSIGVLCRRNSQAKAVARQLRADYPKLGFRLVVGGEFFASEAVREVRALLYAVMAPNDDAAMLELMDTRWANRLRAARGTIPNGVPRDHDLWLKDVGSVFDWKTRMASLSNDGNYRRTDIDGIRARIDSLRSLSRNMPPLAFLLECGRLLEPWNVSRQEDEPAEERSQYERNFLHLVALMEEGFGGGTMSLAGVLSWLMIQMATNRVEDEPRGDADPGSRLEIMTVHRAKGDEFDIVLIPHTWTEIGPPRSAKTAVAVSEAPGGEMRVRWRWDVAGESGPIQIANTGGGTEDIWRHDADETGREEARLLYVAMTRARQHLCIFRLARNSSADTWGGMLASGANR